MFSSTMTTAINRRYSAHFRLKMLLHLTGVDLGLVGVEDKDARRLARMQQSRARRDTGQRRDGLGDGSRPLQREGGEPPRHFQPPRDDRPPSRPYQPPREFQPPRDPQYQRRRPRPPMRDQDGGRLGPRIGASAEPQMPRLASPRWSGQGRILGRPDVKVGMLPYFESLEPTHLSISSVSSGHAVVTCPSRGGFAVSRAPFAT